MRPIDADALIPMMKYATIDNENGIFQIKIGFDAIKKVIDEQPTIESERKKGRWIRITKGATLEQYICPFCHRTIEYDGIEELVSIHYPYCHCGADMQGED